MSSVELMDLGDRVEHCRDIDDVLAELGLTEDPSRKPWFPHLPKFLQDRITRMGVFGSILFYLATVSFGSLISILALCVVYTILGVSAGIPESGHIMIWGISSFIGGIITGAFCSVATEAYADNDKLSAEKKRELLVKYCRNLLENYREKLLGGNTDFAAARSRLEQWAQKAADIIDGIEELLKHGEDPELKADQDEAYEVWEELELSRERLEKRKGAILAFLQRLESRVLSIDTTLGKGILRQELSTLKEGSSTAVELAEQAVVSLVASFGAEAKTLVSVAEHLQIYSNATLSAERIASGDNKALSGATTLLERERNVAAELDQLLGSYLSADESQAHPSLA
jgi:hypothetical protein